MSGPQVFGHSVIAVVGGALLLGLTWGHIRAGCSPPPSLTTLALINVVVGGLLGVLCTMPHRWGAVRELLAGHLVLSSLIGGLLLAHVCVTPPTWAALPDRVDVVAA